MFTREHLRTPLTVALLVAIPALFVVSAASALSDFAAALGGTVAGDAAVALSAGWAAAFVSGTLGFFAASSSRDADRRLALAGLGAVRVAGSRIAASVVLALVAAASAFVALALRVDLAHPWHAAIAVVSFALIYLGVGVLVGSVVRGPLEGSLMVAFVFLLDAFAGPGMTGGSPPVWAVSEKAADVLLAAGAGGDTAGQQWADLALVVVSSLAACWVVFVLSARRRV